MEYGANLVIIPDGNRRWARSRGLPDWEGHRQGYETFKKILRYIDETGEVKFFTFWALSRDNLTKRPLEERKFFMWLLVAAIDELEEELSRSKRGIRLKVVGEWRHKLPWRVSGRLEELEKQTVQNTGLVFTLLLVYDGKWDIKTSMSRIQLAYPHLTEVTDELIHQHLPSRHIPMIDLCIRTGEEAGGMSHNSGGMLMWQMANAKIYCGGMFWPDFSIDDLTAATRRAGFLERRFGA